LVRVNPFGESGYRFVMNKFGGDRRRVASTIIEHCEHVTPGSGYSKRRFNEDEARVVALHYFTESFTVGWEQLEFPFSRNKRFAGSVILNPIDRARIVFPHVNVDEFEVRVSSDGHVSDRSKIEITEVFKDQLMFMIDRGVISVSPQVVLVEEFGVRRVEMVDDVFTLNGP